MDFLSGQPENLEKFITFLCENCEDYIPSQYIPKEGDISPALVEMLIEMDFIFPEAYEDFEELINEYTIK